LSEGVMSATLLDLPALDVESSAARDRDGRMTLEERLQGAWRTVNTDHAADCPVCGGRMALRGGVGECGGCGARLA
jgi:hypothetical protein